MAVCGGQGADGVTWSVAVADAGRRAREARDVSMDGAWSMRRAQWALGLLMDCTRVCTQGRMCGGVGSSVSGCVAAGHGLSGVVDW